MKKYLVFLIICLCSFTFDVYAINKFTVEGDSSAVSGKTFKVSVKYTGESLGSMRLNFSMTNANCTVSSVAAGAVQNCTGGFCDIAYQDVSGYKTGTTFLTMSCTSTASKAIFKASLNDGDAWDVDGLNQIAITQGSKTVTITPTTTTTKKTTTTTNKTTNKTTSKVTTRRTTTTSKIITTKPAGPISTTTTKNTTTTTTTTRLVSDPTTSTSIPTTSKMTTTMEPSTMPEIVEIIKDIPQDMTLKIVGYDLKFNPNLLNYTIDIDSDVTEVYVIFDNITEYIVVENEGIIDVKGKDKFTLLVTNVNTGRKITYTINLRHKELNKQSGINFKTVIIVLIVLIIILIISYLWRKRRSRKIMVEPDTYDIPTDFGFSNNANNDSSLEYFNIEEDLTSVNIKRTP